MNLDSDNINKDVNQDLRGEITDNCPYLFYDLVPCCPLLSCPLTNGYARAKLANVLHVNELQRRVDEMALAEKQLGSGHKLRRFVASSLHPGSVASNIHPFFASKLTSALLRSADEAAKVVMYALQHDTYVPGSYIDSMAKSHDLFNYRGRFLESHFLAHPESRSLQFATNTQATLTTTGSGSSEYTFDQMVWSRKSLLARAPGFDASSTSTSLASKDLVSARLWDVSVQIITDFENNRKQNKNSNAGDEICSK